MSASQDWDALLAELHSLRQFVGVVHKMRHAQHEYFANRTYMNLRHAKALESMVDDMLNVMMPKPEEKP